MIFLGFDRKHDVLPNAGATDKHPFEDKRVHQAFQQAIDIQSIETKLRRCQWRVCRCGAGGCVWRNTQPLTALILLVDGAPFASTEGGITAAPCLPTMDPPD